MVYGSAYALGLTLWYVVAYANIPDMFPNDAFAQCICCCLVPLAIGFTIVGSRYGFTFATTATLFGVAEYLVFVLYYSNHITGAVTFISLAAVYIPLILYFKPQKQKWPR